jgi:hypothetical protein
MSRPSTTMEVIIVLRGPDVIPDPLASNWLRLEAGDREVRIRATCNDEEAPLAVTP